MATLQSISNWDVDADVVIVGAGLAACVTAIEAVDGDPSAKVVLLEKMPEAKTGGASRCAAGYIYCPPEEDLEKLVAYQQALNVPSEVPESVLRTWAEAVCTQRRWIEKAASAAGMRF
jgi:succinate dehydrogenase/fumarate reductase flavoprotein subunit